MASSRHQFTTLPITARQDGATRRVGFELEFSGVTLDDATAALHGALGGRVATTSVAERTVTVDGLGTFNVELDWDFLKRTAAGGGDDPPDAAWLESLSRMAALLVPVEVVCPPLAADALETLGPMVDALREAGAVGTEESLIAAYGVHVNTEIPVLDAPHLDAYLKAFVLLQWWLVDAWGVNATRRISPYIDLYPEAYMVRCLGRTAPGLDTLFADYLEHNATRNRALDLLPMLAELDEARVRRAIDDPKIKARPAFHYRLPDCHIERDDWSLAEAWQSWILVERLAGQPGEIEHLAAAFLEGARPLLGVDRARWVERMDRWLADHASA